jgi:uncharacterized membrane protein
MSGANGLWAVCLLFAAYTIVPGCFPGTVPAVIDGLAVTAFVFVFAVFHGAQRYGWYGILAFVVICLVVSNALEHLSIATGFPFGRYYYTDVLGTKLFLVPLIIGPAYAGAGYPSFMLAHVLIGGVERNDRFTCLARPFVAGILMVSWDLSFDPSASTVARSWIWIDGGPFYGVPLQNFLGWYLTVVLFLLLFSSFQAGRPVIARGRAFWAQAIAMYFVLGVRYPLIYLFATGDAEVTDPAGQVWRTGDIRAASALIATTTMLAFAFIAWLRLRDAGRDRDAVA